MKKLPEKKIEGSLKIVLIIVVVTWIFLFPLIFLLNYLLFYGLSIGEDVSSIILPNSILTVFLFGVTYFCIRNRHSLVLSQTGIKIIHGKRVRNINWSDVSHIDTGSIKGMRFARLFMKQWQQQKESLQGLERWVFIWKDLWIVRSYVDVGAMHLKISHKELLSLVETYFENAKA